MLLKQNMCDSHSLSLCVCAFGKNIEDKTYIYAIAPRSAVALGKNRVSVAKCKKKE